MWRKWCLCKSQANSYRLNSGYVQTPNGVMVVKVAKIGEDFGFTVGGGVETDKLPIAQINEDHSPKPPNKIENGDIILSVNGISVAGCSAADVVSLISACGNEIQLEILPCKRGHGIVTSKIDLTECSFFS